MRRRRQCARRAPHRGGVGDGRHLRDVDRGYGAAAALWSQRQAQLELGRRRCRQDEGRAVGAAGQKPRHCRTCAGAPLAVKPYLDVGPYIGGP